MYSSWLGRTSQRLVNREEGREEHALADGEDVVRELGEELVRVVRVDGAGRAAVGEPGTVVEVARVDKQQVDIAVLPPDQHLSPRRPQRAHAPWRYPSCA
jgi:hypothetical protein